MAKKTILASSGLGCLVCIDDYIYTFREDKAMIRRIETQSTALKIRLWMVILICLQAGPMHTCYCEENGVAAAHENVASAIGKKDYAKAALKCKELAVVASMPEELGKYAESAFLSITRGDDVAYLAAMKGVINHPSAKPEQKTMLLDLMINAPLGAEKYLLVKQGAQLIYTVPSLLNTDSAPMITLAAHVARLFMENFCFPGSRSMTSRYAYSIPSLKHISVPDFMRMQSRISRSFCSRR